MLERWVRVGKLSDRHGISNFTGARDDGAKSAGLLWWDEKRKYMTFTPNSWNKTTYLKLSGVHPSSADGLP